MLEVTAHALSLLTPGQERLDEALPVYKGHLLGFV